MSIVVTTGEVYEHESGEAYEVLNVGNRGVAFKTSDGALVHMDLDEVVEDIAAGVLALQERGALEDE